MKLNKFLALAGGMLAWVGLSAGTAYANHLDGTILCPDGVPYSNVVVTVTGTACDGPTTTSILSGGDGSYLVPLPLCNDSNWYCFSASLSGLPAGATATSVLAGTPLTGGVNLTNSGLTAMFCVNSTNSQETALLNWTVTSSICAPPGPPPMTNCPAVESCSQGNFNGTPIASGDYIWFNSVFNIQGNNNNPTTILFDGSTVTFTVNGNPVTVTIPPAIITFSATATVASTTYNTGMGAWVTTVPDNYNGNVFLSGAAYQLPSNFPGGINPVNWCGNFSGSTAGIKVQWQWAAAVYTTFTTNPNGIGVKPVDNNQISVYQNSDHAGSPENFEQSSYLPGGATGGGGSNWTGSYSGTQSVQLCP